jgi:predicted ArsR family transcriptional regulator
LASNILKAADTLEWITTRHMPFTADDLAKELECTDTTARRILRTVETVGWVERSADPRQQEGRGVNPHTYKSNVRIRRVK